MAERLGLSPERVERGAAALSAHVAHLERLIEALRQPAPASRSSFLVAPPPVAVLFAGGAVLLVRHALVDLEIAGRTARALIARLRAEVAEQAAASSGGSYLQGFLGAEEAQRRYERILEDPGALAALSPAQVAALWSFLSAEQSDRLLRAHPLVVGNCSGVPLPTRMAANRLTALARLESASPLPPEEAGYLDRVAAGAVQLVTYDPDRFRIVEAIGLASWDAAVGRFVERERPPSHLIVYVPGTSSDLPTFYAGDDYQAFVRGLIGDDPGTVAFVYKDGPFPGELDPADPVAAILQASDQGFVQDAGRTLAAFHEDVRRDPLLVGAKQTAIGHSWGLADVAASEVAGARYDQVVSLAGAYLPEGWAPAAGTDYAHHGYNDWLRVLQRLDRMAPDWLVDWVVPDEVQAGGHLVGSGEYPADHPAFVQHAYRAPNDLDLLDNHGLIRDTDRPANVDAMVELRREVYG